MKENKNGIFKFRTTEEFKTRMKEVAKRQNKPVTTVIEDYFNAEFEKLISQKCEKIPAGAGA